MMHRFVCAAAVAGLSSVAAAEITFTFDDPGSGAEFMHMAPNDPAGTGDLDFRGDLPVDLEVVGVGDSAFVGTQNFSAFLVTDFQVGAVTTNPGDAVQSATITGSFQWVDANTNEVILSGEFVEAAIISFGIAGSVVANSSVAGGELAYTPGQALIDLGVTQLIDPQDAVWTLTEVSFAGDEVIDVGGTRFFNTFTANSAFTGTAFIPAPGAVALAGFAGLAAVRRKR